MSMYYYQDLWRKAQDDIKSNITYDRTIQRKGQIKNPETARWIIGHLFMSYVRIVNKLDECYDQIIHPQKREVIGRLLDTVLGRLLEIKRDIVKIELDDYVFFDNILMELKLSPDDVEIRVPQYFWRDREKSKAYRRKLINQVYEELKQEKFKMEYLANTPEEQREQKWQKYTEREAERPETENLEKKRRMEVTERETKPEVEDTTEKTMEDVRRAVLMIQRHERARQSRRNLFIYKRIKRMRQTGMKAVNVPDEIAQKAATVIQQHWRRHWRRVLQSRRLQKEYALLGMIVSSWKDSTKFEKLQEVLRWRRNLQDRNRAEYENVLESVKEKMTKIYSASMNEDTTEEIRYWFEWFFLNTGYLPDYPGEESVVPTGEIFGIPKNISQDFIDKAFPSKKMQTQAPLPKTKLGMSLNGIQPIGGSALVTAEHWIGPMEFLTCQKQLDGLKNSGGGKNPQEKKKLSAAEKAAIKKKDKEAEMKRLKAEGQGYRLTESNFLAPLIKADKDYRDYWLDLNESNNYDQRYIYDLIKDEKCYELSMQVRQAVDEAMRAELEILKDALEKDKNPKKKRKPPRKAKTKKGKGKKDRKDVTGDRTYDDLFTELFKNGIIREYDEAHLKDYIGERSYSAFDQRRRLEDGSPSMGDVRDLILQLCILPLGSRIVHQLSPVIRSVCLMGPEHCGKEFLARIICTETASVMFDLTPENTAGKYTSNSDKKMLLHLVEKMSKILQPSVIMVDGAEKLFYKKVPKEEKKYDPKRLGSALQKIVKGIKPEDQVLVLGISSFPWLCPKPKLTKTFDKFIYVPLPDYGTYYVLWQKLLTPYHSLSRNFDFSCLAKVSINYSVKQIMDVVERVLTPERISRCRRYPYKPADFMEELCKLEPVQEKVLAKCIGFYNKTDERKRRLEKLEELKFALEKNRKK